MGFFNSFNWGSFFSGFINWFQNEFSAQASDASNPTVSTDKSDYHPGETAAITTNGFAAGSTVDFSVQIINPGADGIIGTADDTYTQTKDWLVTDGGAGDADGVKNGSIQTSLPIDSQYANTTILLSATQATVAANGSVTKTGPTATEVFTDDLLPPPLSSLSGNVYFDHNNNGLFSDDAGNGIGAVTVRLTGMTSFGDTVDLTTTTDINGHYSFTDLVASDDAGYTVSETQPAGYLDGKDTAGSTGGDSTTVNDVISGIVLPPGVDSINNNFGELRPASLAGYVYVDANNDGNFDVTETPISGATVTLTGTDDLGNSVTASQSTMPDGSYDFTNLRPGTYTLTETQPAGYLDGKDTQGTPGTGTAGNDIFTDITLNAGVNGNRNNFGELLPASLGDYVWEDTNLNGLQDDGATGIAGVTVTLIGGGADGLLSTTGDNTTTSTTTDANGYYLFSGLTPGEQYQVQFDKPAGYDIVSPRQADANAASGNNSDGLVSDIVTLSSGENNLTIDSGFFKSNPSISIDKVTNDFPATNDGLTILAGEQISWTYTVKNTGNVTLSGVTVTDSDSNVTPVYVSGDTNNDGLLETNETWLFSSGPAMAVDGLYTNTGTVVADYVDGNGQDHTPTDHNDSSYLGITPQISIDKITVDTTPPGASGDGLTILPGEPIEWDYAVTNTGDVALTNVTVTDDHQADGVIPVYDSGDNGNGILDVGETWLYKASGVSIDGTYSNVGTATGSVTDTAGHTATVVDTNGSGYTGIVPEIAIDKVTVDGASSGDGKTILTGESISWQYSVTNAGVTPLSNVTVTDDVLGAVTSYTGDDNNNDLLDTGETWVFTASGTALAGYHANNATATGTVTDSAGHTDAASAMDGSSYTGIAPGINIDKVTVDGASSGDGKTILTGENISWQYTVTNTGTAALGNVTVTDDVLGAVTSYTGDDNNNGLLDTGETWVFTASGTALAGYHANNATATGTATDSAGDTRNATASDGSSYTGIAPGINIDKVTVDGASSGDGKTILTGENISWQYTVTNTGTAALANVTVMDNVLGQVTTHTGDTNNNGLLDTNETWVYTASGTALAGYHANNATATGTATDSAGDTRNATASDGSSYTGIAPGINIDKVTVDGASSGDGKTILTGENISWQYTVTNTGTAALANVTVMDNVLGQVTTHTGDTNNNGLLDTNETWVYTASGTALAGYHANNATVTGTATDSAGDTRNATASDGSSYTGIAPGINIDKQTVYGATSGDGLTIPVGQAISWKYTVTNTGTAALANVTVMDNVLGQVTTYTGDTNNNGLLDTNETWVYTASGVAALGSYSNNATVMGTATDSAGDMRAATASDGSSYTGVASTPHLKIVKSVTCITDKNCDGKTDAGDVVTYGITVTNTGTTTLTNVVVTDTLPNGTVVTVGTIATLLAGKSSTLSTNYTITQADMDSDGNCTGKVTDTATAKDNQGDNVSASASTPISYCPGIDIEKLVSVDGGVNWYFTAQGTGPNATIALIAAETGISSSKLHIGTPTVTVGQQVQFKVVVTNVGDVTDHNVSVADVGDSAALNANFMFNGSATITNLAVGASVVSSAIATTAVVGCHTDVATATATGGTGACAVTVTAKDTETYTGVFVSGKCQQSSNWWCDNHYTCTYTNYGRYTTCTTTDNWNECTYNGQKGILLGDCSDAWGGKTLSKIPSGMLFISDDACSDILNCNSKSDPRLQVAAQAITMQLNIDNGCNIAGDLITEAVQWLTGQGPFKYSDGSTGCIDSNHNSVLDSNEFNTSGGGSLSGSQSIYGKEWTSYVNVGNSTQICGSDLLKALTACNSNGLQLVCSLAGDYVGWQCSNGSVIDVHQNTCDNVWQVLKDQGCISASH